MIPAAAALAAELQAENVATRRVLERVPPNHLDWRPHPNSMTLGQLALHVAAIPGSICQMATLDTLDATTVDFTPAQPESVDAILDAFTASEAAFSHYLSAMDDATASSAWTLTAGAQPLFTLPRTALLRTFALNHLYHHRGQLLVYLRLLDVPVPVVYGRTYDENPFAQSF